MQKATAILCVVLLPGAGTYAIAQPPEPPFEQQQQQAPDQPPPVQYSPEQLYNLVAPIALYPDPLLGQVLAASTYPLEIMEAQQWVGQHPELRGEQLTSAARQQSWDPSVQALVAFPDAMALLSRDIHWTTDLGNAFLAQQADVMNAIQVMRERAQQNGRLQSTPQETVTQQPVPGGPPVIQIQPSNPEVVYVPQFNPEYVWGPPVYGAYPPLWYPSIGFGFGYGAGVFLSGLFAGFLGFGGWGWGLSWLAHGLFLNNLFFHHFGFAGFGGAFGGRSLWAHNPAHRMGVAYPNRSVASRFGSIRYNGAARAGERSFAASRSFAGDASRGYSGRSYSSPSYSSRSYANGAAASRGFNGSAHYAAPRSGSERSFNANRAPSRSERGFSGSNHYSAPRSSGRAPSQHYSAPRSSGSHVGSGHASHSGGGHSGGHGGSHKH
jgi:hypothetical protein